ncbi:MAG: MFS transporter [Candidatus Heimdallarchaeota archaeon]
MQKRQVYGKYIFGMLAVNSFFVYFHRSAVAVIAQDLINEFSISAVQIGFLGSMFFYAYALMQLPAGAFTDVLGPRKTLTLFTGITSLAALVFSMAPNLLLASIARFLIGVGSSVVFICAMKILARWFHSDQVSSYVGFFMLAGNLGAIGATAPLALLTVELGWRRTFEVLALISGLLAVLSWVIVRDMPKQSNSKRDRGLLHKESVPPPKVRFSSSEVKGVLLNRQLLSVSAVLSVSFGTLMAFSGLWAVPYLMHTYQLSKTEASYLVSVTPIGISIGAPLFGLLSDKVIRGRKTVLMLGTFGHIVAWIPLAFRTGNLPRSGLLVIFFTLGLCYGLAPIAAAMAKELVEERHVGLAVGYCNMWPFLSVTLYQPLIGYILDIVVPVQGHEGVFSITAYSWAFRFCLSSLMLVSLLFFFLKETFPPTQKQHARE